MIPTTPSEATPDPAVRELSVFFPAHDEAANLERVVTNALSVLERLPLETFEVIVVDDGSSDGTGAIGDALATRDARVRVVHHPSRRGYGAALKSGFAASRLAWIFFSDSDGQFDLAEIERLLLYAAENDAVVGFRAHRSDHAVRKLNQFLWAELVRRLFGLTLRDIDCAFKLLRRSSVERAGPLVSDGAALSAELLVKLQRSGARIAEVGVSHYPRTAGQPSGGDPRVIAKAFRELFRLRRHLRTSAATSAGATEPVPADAPAPG